MWFLTELFEGVYQTGRWPIGVYPGLAALLDDLSRADRLRRDRACGGDHLTPRLGDARHGVGLHRGAVRVRPLVLALRPAPLLRRVGLARGDQNSSRLPSRS